MKLLRSPCFTTFSDQNGYQSITYQRRDHLVHVISNAADFRVYGLNKFYTSHIKYLRIDI